MRKKKICILGSTGSIGRTTLEIILKNKKDFDVVLLSGNNNVELLISQAKKFKPKYVYSNNFFFKEKLKTFCKNNNIYFIDDLNSLKKIKFDVTIAAISGMAGLLPTINIIKFSKKILIANKESIICGWKFILKELKKHHCNFTPIDSEHFSILNLIENKNLNSVKYIYLTASGGPFFEKKVNLNKVTPAQAAKHPNWKMGKKISIDSANLMNKVLEVIEASLIFNLPINKFKIIIHPQSLIHAIIEFKNGLSSMLYHYNDMKIPITNSLYNNFYNYKNNDHKFLSQNKLTFIEANSKKNPSLKILNLNNVLNENGFILINALNEILVQKFLKNKITFPDITNKLIGILNTNNVKNYLKNHQIRHINDVFKVYNFSRSIVN
ncbi:K00099 dxr; 1-deoxy-D-xylulose-5-phosphate reductoisomerase [Candidatus Pelagibacterales bacterium]|jgi:1-deoxy-D-xylulose-5-phosphate reductoisomerase